MALHDLWMLGVAMLVRMTRKAMAKVKVTASMLVESAPSAEFLAEWYVNLFYMERKYYFILTESVSLYSVIVDAKGCNAVKQFEALLARAIERAFHENGVFRLPDMDGPIEYGRTANRSVLGSQNDFVFMAQVARERDPEGDLSWVNESPMSAIGDEMPFNKFKEEMDKKFPPRPGSSDRAVRRLSQVLRRYLSGVAAKDIKTERTRKPRIDSDGHG